MRSASCWNRPVSPPGRRGRGVAGAGSGQARRGRGEDRRPQRHPRDAERSARGRLRGPGRLRGQRLLPTAICRACRTIPADRRMRPGRSARPLAAGSAGGTRRPGVCCVLRGPTVARRRPHPQRRSVGTGRMPVLLAARCSDRRTNRPGNSAVHGTVLAAPIRKEAENPSVREVRTHVSRRSTRCLNCASNPVMSLPGCRQTAICRHSKGDHGLRRSRLSTTRAGKQRRKTWC